MDLVRLYIRLRRRVEVLEGHVRWLRSQRKGHTETKTFIVGGDLDTDIEIPPFCVGIDADLYTPEVKLLWGFRSRVRAGAVDLEWHLNDVLIAGSEQTATDSGVSEVVLTDPIEVSDSDWVHPVIVDSSSGAHLSAAVVLVTMPEG